MSRRYQRRHGRPRIWVHLGCIGCSIPLLAAAAAVALAVVMFG